MREVARFEKSFALGSLELERIRPWLDSLERHGPVSLHDLVDEGGLHADARGECSGRQALGLQAAFQDLSECRSRGHAAR